MLYTLRQIPDELHRRWKYCAAYFDLTMRDLAIMAIENYVERYEKVIREREGDTDENQ